MVVGLSLQKTPLELEIIQMSQEARKKRCRNPKTIIKPQMLQLQHYPHRSTCAGGFKCQGPNIVKHDRLLLGVGECPGRLQIPTVHSAVKIRGFLTAGVRRLHQVNLAPVECVAGHVLRRRHPEVAVLVGGRRFHGRSVFGILARHLHCSTCNIHSWEGQKKVIS